MPRIKQEIISPVPLETLNQREISRIAKKYEGKKDIKFFEKNILPYTRKGSIPDELAAGQWAGESGGSINSETHNYFGLKKGGKVMKFKDDQEGIKAYTDTVKNIISSKKGESITDTKAETLLNLMQKPVGKRYEAHNKDPQEYVRFIKGTPEWRYFQK